MRHRPKLKPGDVCAFSNKAKGKNRRHNASLYRYYEKTRMVVLGVFGTGADQHDSITCTVTPDGKGRVRKQTFRRSQLWWTGRNISDSSKKSKVTFDPQGLPIPAKPGPITMESQPKTGDICGCNWDQLLRGEGHDPGCADIVGKVKL